MGATIAAFIVRNNCLHKKEPKIIWLKQAFPGVRAESIDYATKTSQT